MYKNFQGKLVLSAYTNSIKEFHPSKVAQDLIIIRVESQCLEGVIKVKDRLGDQRGGGEWEPIKILS
jgi:hypothetical protein